MGWDQLPQEMKDQIAEELNVLSLQDIATADGDLVHVKVKANFRSLGAKYGASVQEIARSIAKLDPVELVASVRSTGRATVKSETGNWAIDADDLVITEEPKMGWTVASHDGESVALDLALTEALVSAGHVREVVRALQESRKSQGFDISDRIIVKWNATNEVATAVEEELSYIGEEVLARSITRDLGIEIKADELGFSAVLQKAN